MIGRLRGMVELTGASGVVLDVQGVGYELSCPVSTIKELADGEESKLFVHTEMRDSEIRLYGFHTTLEKQLFEFLLQVNGVGPKSALEILSSADASELIRIIGSGDAPRIQKVKGIGKKTAERIVLELQDKLSHYAVESSSLQDRIEVLPASSQEEDSVLALVSLGFSKQEAGDAVTKAVAANKKLADAGDIVKAALSYL